MTAKDFILPLEIVIWTKISGFSHPRLAPLSKSKLPRKTELLWFEQMKINSEFFSCLTKSIKRKLILKRNSFQNAFPKMLTCLLNSQHLTLTRARCTTLPGFEISSKMNILARVKLSSRITNLLRLVAASSTTSPMLLSVVCTASSFVKNVVIWVIIETTTTKFFF